MNSVADKKNLLKQVIEFALNVFSTRFFYQLDFFDSEIDIEVPTELSKLLISMAISIQEGGSLLGNTW